MKNNLSICLVGGEDAHKRIELSQHLIKKGFDVTILGTKSYQYPSNVTFVKYELNRKSNLFSDIVTISQYRRILKKREFDIVQTFDTKPAFILPISAIGLKVKIVRTITGLGTIFMSEEIKYKIFRAIYHLLHRSIRAKVAHTTFQNADDRNYFIKKGLVDKEKSSLIFGSGIDLLQYTSPPPKTNKRFTFICVARLVYEKGIVNYLEAAKICSEKGYDFNFTLVGPLEENSNKLNKQILEDYKDYIDWLGSRKDVKNLLAQSNAFVLPTFREGFSRVLLEASAMGLPSITTNVPGTREIVRTNKEGLLVDVNNSNELAHAMIKMATDKKLHNICSVNAKNHVKQFGLDRISNQYINLYRKIG
ncbi:glycosyltransferase family 4 protein [Allomuricauda sp. R78024]|uniref:glycosyltransferase family 4 protein n=1 Tax=Allomuricauda sp. R78024 TaxID=3093867 RepID=UPI0037CBA824